MPGASSSIKALANSPVDSFTSMIGILAALLGGRKCLYLPSDGPNWGKATHLYCTRRGIWRMSSWPNGAVPS